MQVSEFEASLVYRVSSRTAKATQRNPVAKQNKTKKNKQKGIYNLGGLESMTVMAENMAAHKQWHWRCS